MSEGYEVPLSYRGDRPAGIQGRNRYNILVCMYVWSSGLVHHGYVYRMQKGVINLYQGDLVVEGAWYTEAAKVYKE